MKRIYYIISDTTRNASDPLQMYYDSINPLNDITGALTEIARRNKTEIKDLRLYVCPDKKTYERMQADYIKRITKPDGTNPWKLG